MSFLLLIVQSILLLKIAEGAQKCYFGDFVDGKIKECKESSWKCATLICPGTVFRGCLSPNGVCGDLINLFTSCKESSPQCFLCEGDLCNDNSTNTSNKKFEATSVLSGANDTNITEESSTPFIAKDVPIESSTNSTATNSSSPIESITNQNATAEMLKSNAGNNTVNGSNKNSNSQYYIQSFLIALFFVVATII